MLERKLFGWCMAAALAALLPLGLQLVSWLGPLLGLLAVLGGIAGLRGVTVPPWLRLLLTIGVAGLVMFTYEFRFGRDTGAGLLATMLALKLLETHRLRDARSLLSFSLFAIMAAFLQDQGPLTLGLALIATVLALTALARASELESGAPAEAQRVPAQLGLSASLMMLSLPLAIAGFLLFPRLPQPLWGLPDNAAEARTGLSESMSPGDISALFIDDSPILRVQFSGPRPEQSELFWRGPVLSEFDGRSWTLVSWMRHLEPAAMQLTGRTLQYELIQEPTDRRWVLALDVPLAPANEAPGVHELRLSQDRSVLSRRPLAEVSRHPLVSSLGAVFEPNLPLSFRQRLLALPQGFNPRARDLVEGWRQQGLDADGKIRAALQLFNREFTYSLTPPPLGRDSIDDFLFNTREGYCEHFSSAFTVMMRMAGIPARVVTGYQGGFYNPIGDYVVVRQSDAHAWSEVWLQDRGWVRIDPTAAVAPERIRSGGDSAESRRGAFLQAFGPLLDAADWVRHGWNTVVLGFNSARQRSLMLSFGIDGSDWREVGLALIGGFGLALGLTLWLVMRGARTQSDPLVAAYLKLCGRLARRGVRRALHEPVLAFAERAAALLPDDAERLRELSSDYAQQRYAANADASARAALILRLQRFRPRSRRVREHISPRPQAHT
jgi:transglutaminase-like putative cysteine protease